jgi:23S rRNA (uracil1939-C5)-methyltransferase
MSLPIAWKGKIESVSQAGLGVGTLLQEEDGIQVKRPVFVPFTTPGDEVKANIIEQKRKYSFAVLEQVIAPSEHRVVPVCPHFTICGGCNLQHISYDEQLRQKAQQIQFLLKRKGMDVQIKMLGSKQRHNYRWRAKVALRFGTKITAGFRKFHSHEIIGISTCFIVAPQIVEFIKLLNATASPFSAEFDQQVIVVVGEGKKLGVLIPLDDTPRDYRKQVRDFFEDIYGKNRKSVANLFFEEDRKTRTSGQVQEHITYSSGGLKFAFLPETFIQSNVLTNELLTATALQMLFKGDKSTKGITVIDLYAGLGNLSLPIAQKAKQVVAVEGHEVSVLLGRINSYQNGISNAYFVHRSVEKYLYEYVRSLRGARHTDEYPKAQRIVLDPPRTGLTPVAIKSLLQSNVERILYVSCNPVTLANDLAALNQRYKVIEAIGIDMFPDISHVETLVLLEARAP